MKAIYDKSIANVEIIKSRRVVKGKTIIKKEFIPRDLHLAQTIAKEMAALDLNILKTQQDLILMKQKLGLVESPVQEGVNLFSGDVMIINAPNLMRAWQLRKQRRLEKQNGKAHHEEAKLINGPDTDDEAVSDIDGD
jgi:hypothetical protein